MRNLAIAGSVADRLNGVSAQLKACPDLPAIEYRYGRIVGALEQVARRVAMVWSRGGSIAGLETSLGWLDQVVRDHPALEGLDGEPLRSELLRLAENIRRAGRR